MRQILSFIILLTVKFLALAFYRFEKQWLNEAGSKVSVQAKNWNDIKLIIILNHTSLFEPLFVSQAPNSFLWLFSKNLLVPGADITLNRPIIGRFYKYIAPGVIPISRKRDDSWKKFMQLITPKAIVAILPEGRMKRKNGLDKHGKPMSVRGGVADILELMNTGNILFVYSGGLHHIQTPGQRFPKIFKKIKLNLETIKLSDYKDLMSPENNNNIKFRKNVIKDLNKRLLMQLPS